MTAKKKNSRRPALAGQQGASRQPAAGRPAPSLIARAARANGAQLHAMDWIEAAVPNPFGEVMVDGLPRPHICIKRDRQFTRLARAGTITRADLAALEIFDRALGMAESGAVKSGLDFSGCASAGSAGVPISEAVLAARSEVKWMLAQVPLASRAVFAAVMIDDLALIEAARRQCARRQVRASVERQRKVLARALSAGAAALTAALARRDGPRPGRIRMGQW